MPGDPTADPNAAAGNGTGAPAVSGGDGQTDGAVGGSQSGAPGNAANGDNGATQGNAPAGGSPSPLAGGGVDPSAPTNTGPATWPDDWREKLAGGDTKKLENLKRFADPAALSQALFETRAKLSSLKPQLEKPGKDATPEQIAEYRNAYGIPENKDGYIASLAFADGRKLGEADKVIADHFAESALEIGLPKEAFNGVVNWYLKMQEAQVNAEVTRDNEIYAKTTQTLKQEWGPDFPRNINAIETLWDGAPPGLKENLLGARLADGTRLGDNADAIRWLSGTAMNVNPVAALMPSGAGSVDSLMTRKAEIEADMKKDYNAYMRDNVKQAEYMKITEIMERVQKRAA